jgi:hypothetical protein
MAKDFICLGLSPETLSTRVVASGYGLSLSLYFIACALLEQQLCDLEMTVSH